MIGRLGDRTMEMYWMKYCIVPVFLLTVRPNGIADREKLH